MLNRAQSLNSASQGRLPKAQSPSNPTFVSHSAQQLQRVELRQDSDIIEDIHDEEYGSENNCEQMPVDIDANEELLGNSADMVEEEMTPPVAEM